jgi:ATP-dependent DNA helicase RecQ
MDFPLPRGTDLGPETETIISVAESLLTRGSTPYCSPQFEQVLRDLIPEAFVSGAVQAALQTCAHQPSSVFIPDDFGSPEESVFFGLLTEFMESRHVLWSVIPQVYLSGLAPGIDPDAQQHGDFLLSHPGRPSIVVEIDGKAHEAHTASDSARDHHLAQSGVSVIRIPAEEVRAGQGPELDELKRVLEEVESPAPSETATTTVVRVCKLAHQIQLVLLEALRGGWVRNASDASSNIGIVLPTSLAGNDRAETVALFAVYDFVDLLSHLAELYGWRLDLTGVTPHIVGDTDVDADLVVMPGDLDPDALGIVPTLPLFLTSDIYVPYDIAPPVSPASPVRVASPPHDVAQWFLSYCFRKPDFWEGQWETVQRSLQGKDSVVLLPTGSGKSIAFQLSALLLPGRCIVVDPIISLIDDQIDNLARVGIDRCIGITSQIASPRHRERILQAFADGLYLFCYVAPERFQTVPFRESLRALTVGLPVSLIAIDEAHCVSEWGHDFRTAYLNLGRISRDYCASRATTPPLIALTGTASKTVLKDVQRELGIEDFDAIITPKSFDRPELHYTVLECRSDEKAGRVQGFLTTLPGTFRVAAARFFQPQGDGTFAGLVFCPHVNGEFGVVQQSENLARALNTPVEFYSGGPPRNFDSRTWDVRKRATARRFKRNESPILVATSAFGMGIDKPNVRFTVHIGLPDSIESFYQEAGRAGRDRHRSECALIVSIDDPARTRKLLDPGTPIEEIIETVKTSARQDGDDILRAMWFHANSFRGREQELRDVATVIGQIGELDRRRSARVTWPTDGKEAAERALHRLVVLGIVADYTVDYAASEFALSLSGASQAEIADCFGRYAASYQKGLGKECKAAALSRAGGDHARFALATAELLVDFIYQHIELARRRSMNEMLTAATSATDGESLRQRILQYLEHSEYDEALDDVVNSMVGGVDRLGPLLDNVVSMGDAAMLRGAVARRLGSYPDVPGLLLLRSYSEALAADTDAVAVRENLEAAVNFAFSKYGLETDIVAKGVGQVLVALGTRAGAVEYAESVILGFSWQSRDFIRQLLQHIPIELSGGFARWLNRQLTSKSAEMRAVKGGRT